MPTKKRAKSRRNPATPPPPKTVACPACQQAIVIPRSCRHGKKLINCQGTDCSTAHITAHKDTCPANMNMTSRQEEQHTNDPAQASAQQGEHHKFDPAQRSAMLTWAIGKAIHNIEEHRTKEMKYLDGIPKAEFLQRLPTMTTVNKEQIMMKLDGIQTGTTTVEAAMYDDDEDSDTDGEDCATPPEPEENEDCEVHARD